MVFFQKKRHAGSKGYEEVVSGLKAHKKQTSWVIEKAAQQSAHSCEEVFFDPRLHQIASAWDLETLLVPLFEADVAIKKLRIPGGKFKQLLVPLQEYIPPSPYATPVFKPVSMERVALYLRTSEYNDLLSEPDGKNSMVTVYPDMEKVVRLLHSVEEIDLSDNPNLTDITPLLLSSCLLKCNIDGTGVSDADRVELEAVLKRNNEIAKAPEIAAKLAEIEAQRQEILEMTKQLHAEEDALYSQKHKLVQEHYAASASPASSSNLSPSAL